MGWRCEGGETEMERCEGNLGMPPATLPAWLGKYVKKLVRILFKLKTNIFWYLSEMERCEGNFGREIPATLPVQILFKIKTNTFEYLSVMEV